MVLSLLDQRLEIFAELLEPRDNRRGARVAQHADRLARHVLGNLEQRVEVFRRSLAFHDPLEDLRRPRGAFTTLRALRAALVSEEASGAGDLLHEVLRLSLIHISE